MTVRAFTDDFGAERVRVAGAPQASSAAKFGTIGINFRATRARSDEEWSRELSVLDCRIE